MSENKLPPHVCLFKFKEVVTFSENAPCILLSCIKFTVVNIV